MSNLIVLKDYVTLPGGVATGMASLLSRGVGLSKLHIVNLFEYRLPGGENLSFSLWLTLCDFIYRLR